MTRVLAWVVVAALAGCGAGNAEIRIAKTATYHGSKTEILQRAADATASDYKLAGRTEDGFVTQSRWYSPEGDIESAGAGNVSQVRPGSVSVSFDVELKEAAGPGDASAITVTPVTIQYVQGSPKPRELKPDDPYLPSWVLCGCARGEDPRSAARVRGALMRRALACVVLAACGGGGGTTPGDDSQPPDASISLPVGDNGNPDGHCALAADAAPEDVSSPTTVVGTGTADSCTAQEVVDAVHAGGVVTFSCGADPITIVVPEIDIFNDGGLGDGSVTIDGGGLVTLSGGGTNRVIYQNTCDESLHFTTPHCQAQDAPHLVIQNLGITNGRADATDSVPGGGAMYVGGGTFKAYNVRVDHSTQPNLKQDYAGGGIYTFNQATRPVYVSSSTFADNTGCNGGALASIGTAWTIANSIFDGNQTLGNGQNPAKPGTPGGGLGGAIYNDGNDYTLTICGTKLTANTAAELGSGTVFQVVDNLNGDLVVSESAFAGNSNVGSVQSADHPSIYVEARDKVGMAGVTITDTTFE